MAAWLRGGETDKGGGGAREADRGLAENTANASAREPHEDRRTASPNLYHSRQPADTHMPNLSLEATLPMRRRAYTCEAKQSRISKRRLATEAAHTLHYLAQAAQFRPPMSSLTSTDRGPQISIHATGNQGDAFVAILGT